VAVADAGQPVLAPAVGLRACLVVREVRPGFAVGGVIFADGAPGAFTDVGPPAAPVGGAGAVLIEPEVLGGGGGHGVGLSVGDFADDARPTQLGEPPAPESTAKTVGVLTAEQAVYPS